MITRAVGSRDYVQVDTSVWDSSPGDAYLLCSDGLHGYLRLEEVVECLSDGHAAAVDCFIDLANGRGEKIILRPWW